MSQENKTPLSPVEGIKSRSNFLRGSLLDSLADSASGALAEDDTQLSKFHGFYQQDDRDKRNERQRQKLEPAYSFMIRVRVPGGIATPGQWLAMDALATSHANNSLRLTTRQAFQFHGVIKRDLKPTIRAINDSLLDTIAACGDVNRNVMCTPLAEQSAVHAEAGAIAAAIGEHLLPRTRAYHEIWLDGERVAGGEEREPIYGETYLPRKFKIAVVIPPSNDVDIFSQDLGFIAVEKHGKLEGFNVVAGGGMGMTHGEPETYPRVADVIGFCRPEQAINVAEQVVALQRDHGDRSNRKHARLKYTIADRGVHWFSEELERRLGYPLDDAREFHFESRGDRFGWLKDSDGYWHLTIFVPQGRLQDDGERNYLSALRAVARLDAGEFRLTANQNLVISRLNNKQKKQVEALLEEHGIPPLEELLPLRRLALACVALPTCGLAMAEAERYLPELTDKVGVLLQRHGLQQEAIALRITGCPNGCARPYLAEIALVGKAPGHYSLFLGGDEQGRRLNRQYLAHANEERVLATLDEWFGRFERERVNSESFGDFANRLMDATADTHE